MRSSGTPRGCWTGSCWQPPHADVTLACGCTAFLTTCSQHYVRAAGGNHILAQHSRLVWGRGQRACSAASVEQRQQEKRRPCPQQLQVRRSDAVSNMLDYGFQGCSPVYVSHFVCLQRPEYKPKKGTVANGGGGAAAAVAEQAAPPWWHQPSLPTCQSASHVSAGLPKLCSEGACLSEGCGAHTALKREHGT